MKDKFLQLLSYVLVACIASIATYALSSQPASTPGMSKLEEVQYAIETYFVGKTDQQVLVDNAAAAMVEATGDRWSYYIPAADMQAHDENQNNAYVGVGVTIQDREDGTGMDVMEVTAGGPAQEAGILPGDIISAVDGQSVAKIGLDGAKNAIRGDVGTMVKITVLRGGNELVFDVERRAIQVVVATGELLAEGVGLVTIENFNSTCAKKTIAVIEDLRKQGATSLILDVRFNPGGFRNELVELLDYLLPEGDLFRSEHYNGSVQVDTSDASFLDMPMAVLVNGDSYSAAEFFAAALWEYEAATVVGTQTCGKGYYQMTVGLSDGSAINLSMGRYYTPKGVSLAEAGGLTPEILVEVDEQTYFEIYYGTLAPEEDPQVQAAVKVLTGK